MTLTLGPIIRLHVVCKVSRAHWSARCGWLSEGKWKPIQVFTTEQGKIVHITVCRTTKMYYLYVVYRCDIWLVLVLTQIQKLPTRKIVFFNQKQNHRLVFIPIQVFPQIAPHPVHGRRSTWPNQEHGWLPSEEASLIMDCTVPDQAQHVAKSPDKVNNKVQHQGIANEISTLEWKIWKKGI